MCNAYKSLITIIIANIRGSKEWSPSEVSLSQSQALLQTAWPLCCPRLGTPGWRRCCHICNSSWGQTIQSLACCQTYTWCLHAPAGVLDRSASGCSDAWTKMKRNIIQADWQECKKDNQEWWEKLLQSVLGIQEMLVCQQNYRNISTSHRS